MLRDFFLGFIRIHILHHASREPVYGLWLIEELAHHGYKLSPGTLYPILHNLEKEKILKSFTRNVDGKIRKYYRTTSKGDRTLSKLRKSVAILMEEITEA
jgi:PadR family transcriptional regulator PadR